MCVRWGVISYADSLDTVGIMAKNVADIRLLYGQSVLDMYAALSYGVCRYHLSLRQTGPYQHTLGSTGQSFQPF